MLLDLAKLVLLALVIMWLAPKLARFIISTPRLAYITAWSTVDIGRQALQIRPRNALAIFLALCALAAPFLLAGVNLLTIVPVLTISLVIMVPLGLWGSKPSRWVWGLCAMYTASYFIANSWHLAFWILDPLPVEIADALKAIMKDAPANAYGFALRIDQANKRLLVALYAAIVVLALSNDRQAQIIALILAVAEAFSFLENVECKLLKDPFGSQDLHLTTIWGIEVSRYACARAFGSLTPYAAPFVTSICAIWINARMRHDNRPPEGG